MSVDGTGVLLLPVDCQETKVQVMLLFISSQHVLLDTVPAFPSTIFVQSQGDCFGDDDLPSAARWNVPPCILVANCNPNPASHLLEIFGVDVKSIGNYKVCDSVYSKNPRLKGFNNQQLALTDSPWSPSGHCSTIVTWQRKPKWWSSEALLPWCLLLTASSEFQLCPNISIKVDNFISIPF